MISQFLFQKHQSDSWLANILVNGARACFVMSSSIWSFLPFLLLWSLLSERIPHFSPKALISSFFVISGLLDCLMHRSYLSYRELDKSFCFLYLPLRLLWVAWLNLFLWCTSFPSCEKTCLGLLITLSCLVIIFFFRHRSDIKENLWGQGFFLFLPSLVSLAGTFYFQGLCAVICGIFLTAI